MKRRAPGQSYPGSTSFVALAAVIMAQQVASKALRDSLFLAHSGVSDLPKVMLVSALTSIVVISLVSRGMQRWGPTWAARTSFAASGAGYVAVWSLLPKAPDAAGWLLYIQIATLGSITGSAFWSRVNEHFDPHEMKRHVGRILAGGAVGGFVGGVVIERLAQRFDARSLLLGMMAASFATAAALLRSTSGSRATAFGHGASALRILRDSSYLRSVAWLVVAVGVMSALLDYSFKLRAARDFVETSDLTRFFAAFYVVTNVGTVLLQTSLAPRVLQRAGIAGTLAVLPSAVLASSLFAILLPRLATTALLRGAAVVLENSLFRSGYEPLYTPVRAEPKRAVKAAIDVIAARLGDAFGSVAVLAAVALSPGVDDRLVLVLAALAAGLALWLSMRLHSGYVRELTACLKSGTLSLADTQPQDSTTRFVLTLARPMLPSSHEPPSGTGAVGAPIEQIRYLVSGDREQVLAGLDAVQGDRRLVPFAIELLGRDDTSHAALSTLRACGEAIAGQLVDVLLDEAQSAILRCRVTRVLKGTRHARSVRGLTDALAALSFEVRYAAALALNELVETTPELRPPRSLLVQIAERELDVSSEVWFARRAVPELESAHGTAAREDGGRVSLAHVFNLLAITGDREGLRLAHQALLSRDQRRRGTALEYLDSVLPNTIAKGIARHVEREAGPPRRVGMSRIDAQLAKQLKQSLIELERLSPVPPRK